MFVWFSQPHRGFRAPTPVTLLPMTAALRLADAEMLNAMLIRRDHCSKSAIKSFSSGMETLQRRLVTALVAALPDTTDSSMTSFISEHLSGSLQAVTLMNRKDDLIRRVRMWGPDELGMQLNHICPSLNDVQIAKLVEHHHDDILVAYGTRDSVETTALISCIKRTGAGPMSAHASPLKAPPPPIVRPTDVQEIFCFLALFSWITRKKHYFHYQNNSTDITG